MKCNIKFDSIEPSQRVIWRRAICSALESLPKDEKNVVPDIHIYPTLIKSLIMNFDPNDFRTDEIATEFYKGSAWAYSRMRGVNKKKFISFSVKRYNSIKEFVTPEFTIFHEIGHFQVSDRLKQSITAKNMKEIELKCDRYGLFALVRMLHNQKHYKTISVKKEQIQFERNVRKLIDQIIGKGKLSAGELRHKYAEISDVIMKLMKWEAIYE